MTGRELIFWFLQADKMSNDDVLDMEIDFGPDVFRNDTAIGMRGASVQGDRVQLY